MRALFCVALALLATTSCTIAPEKKHPGWPQATSGEQHERLFWDAVKAKDWRNIDAHLSATIVTQSPNAVRNKQQTMEHIQQLNLVDYTLGDLKTETAGPDFIVTYTITVHGTFNGQPIPDQPQRMMSVWQQIKHGMVMTAHTSMPTS